MRRRRRRDALRLALVRVLEIMSEEKTFSRTPTVIDSDSGFLASTFTDYIDGARYEIPLFRDGVGTGTTGAIAPVNF